MSKPHERVAITDLVSYPGRDWPAVELTITLDGLAVAHLENKGAGDADLIFAAEGQNLDELYAVAEEHCGGRLQGERAVSELVTDLLAG